MEKQAFLLKRKVQKICKKFIRLSYEERKEMGIAGRRHMEVVFDKKKVVEETISYLKNE